MYLPTQASNHELVYYPTNTRSAYYKRFAVNSNSNSYYLSPGGLPAINYGDIPSNQPLSSPTVETVTEPFFDFASTFAPASQPFPSKSFYSLPYQSVPSAGLKERPQARISHPRPRKPSSEQSIDEVDLVKMESGEETRTCIMLRNLPNRYRREQIASVLYQAVGNNFNIMSMPCDPQTDRNLGYCFVQFASPADVVKAYRTVAEEEGLNRRCRISIGRIPRVGKFASFATHASRPMAGVSVLELVERGFQTVL